MTVFIIKKVIVTNQKNHEKVRETLFTINDFFLLKLFKLIISYFRSTRDKKEEKEEEVQSGHRTFRRSR